MASTLREWESIFARTISKSRPSPLRRTHVVSMKLDADERVRLEKIKWAKFPQFENSTSLLKRFIPKANRLKNNLCSWIPRFHYGALKVLRILTLRLSARSIHAFPYQACIVYTTCFILVKWKHPRTKNGIVLQDIQSSLLIVKTRILIYFHPMEKDSIFFFFFFLDRQSALRSFCGGCRLSDSSGTFTWRMDMRSR